MAPIYDKPVRLLFGDMVKDLDLKKGDVLTKQQGIDWFRTNYPKINSSTVSAHFIRLSTNAPTRVHYHAGPDDDLLFQLDGSHFRLYAPDSDPPPIYEKEPQTKETHPSQPTPSSLSEAEIIERLKQWQIEVTDPNHPNHDNADLDWPTQHHAAIMKSVDQLHMNPDSFTKEDVVRLFGQLNSGNRMKNMVVANNPLPELRQQLIDLLFGDGEPIERIRAADASIRYAGENMLGELFGWVHAEEAPLFNQCATDALAHLGYDFPANDYEAFVAAHEDFKQIYLNQVEPIRPSLPINLEIDKFYNVIDKVDLKRTADVEQDLVEPFSLIFESREEAEWAFNLIRSTLEQVGITSAEDGRFALTLADRYGGLNLHLNIGSWLILGFRRPEMTSRRVRLTLATDLLHNTEDLYQEHSFRVFNGNNIKGFGVPLNRVRPFESELETAYFRALSQCAKRISSSARSRYRRLHVADYGAAVFDKAKRDRLFSIGSSWSTTSEPDEEPEMINESLIANDFKGFSSETFEFLAGLEENNDSAWMQANKSRYIEHVREPFRSLFVDLGPALKQLLDPYLAPDALNIEPKFGRTLATIKKRWPDDEGPYHSYYWGAFYRDRLTKQTDAQLFVSLQSDHIRFGFYVGERAKNLNSRFQQRVLDDPEIFFEIATDLGLIRDFQFVRTYADNKRDVIEIKTATDLSNWVESGEYDLLYYLESEDIIVRSPQFVNFVFESLRRVFPVYLWAIADDYLTEIDRFLAQEFPDPDIDDDPPPPPEPYTEQSFTSNTFLMPQTVTELREMLSEKRQLIFYGPPGTGKTFVARELGKLITGLAEPPPDRLDIIQFHPAYSYEDFVEGIRPESKIHEGRHIVDYPPKAGTFRRFCQNAQRIDGPCIFIIDEINRGNIPRIFGELMLLLEYRNLDVPLPYSGSRFRIPENVFIIGTMNTADRSIALVDFALRRRFHFFHFAADPDLYERWLQANPVDIPYIAVLYQRLSQEAVDDPNFAIGPSYFMDPALSEYKLERIWRRSIVPYLHEYYFDQPAKIKRWLWDSEFMQNLRQTNSNG